MTDISITPARTVTGYPLQPADFDAGTQETAEHSAILVGTRTAELDNPGLNVRHWYGRSPVRIVLDRQQSYPQPSPI